MDRDSLSSLCGIMPLSLHPSGEGGGTHDILFAAPRSFVLTSQALPYPYPHPACLPLLPVCLYTMPCPFWNMENIPMTWLCCPHPILPIYLKASNLPSYPTNFNSKTSVAWRHSFNTCPLVVATFTIKLLASPNIT